ncbi:MAG: hypothetical protein K2K70_08285 [Lachnospiraceae bacterium]|nr:hypothetical protein [Lachnospiraceae bacterium]
MEILTYLVYPFKENLNDILKNKASEKAWKKESHHSIMKSGMGKHAPEGNIYKI